MHRSRLLLACLFSVLLLAASAIRFSTPAGAQASRDLPPPAANLTTIPTGSLVIAMDNTNQSLVAPFNLKAYGLVHNLLRNGIPVLWAIRAGKTKDGIDFTATAQRFAPTTTTAASYNFSGGPFIVHRDYAELAKARITAFGNSVAVYQLTQDVIVDVRYQLTDKPLIAVSNVNTSIHTSILTEAGIPDYTVVDPTTLSAGSCYTIHSEPHTSATAGIPNVKAFVQSGGNFMAQCAAVDTFENTATGRFQTTAGIVVDNDSSTIDYPNADLSFSQFVGALEPAPGGSVQDWRLAAGSTFTGNAHIHANDTGVTPPHYAASVTKVLSGVGGMVFYLGGHDYNASTIGDKNGRRMYLNAVFTPASRPSSCNLNFGAQLRTVSGRVYEDLNGDGSLLDGVARAGVTVRLYADINNNGVVDTGDTFLGEISTDASGGYSFQVSTASASGNYYLVAVDSKGVAPSAGLRGGSTQGDVWAEETYGDNPATSVLDIGPRFGGRQASVSDTFNTSNNAPANNTYEHIARLDLSGASASNVNFGFSFNVVTNSRAGDTADDDTTANRTVQGSLRQFLQNANAINGPNYMRFVPATSADAGTYWRVTVSNTLPAFNDSDTTVDGTAYSNANGTSVVDTNSGSTGAGGTVGVDALTLPQGARPELEIVKSGSVAVGFDLQAARSTVRRVAIYGFGTTANSDTSGNIRVGTVVGALVEECFVGSTATSFTDPGATRSAGDNIRVVSGSGGTIRNNLIGFSSGKGIQLGGGANAWSVTGNEVRGNGIGNSNLDGIDVENGSGNATITGNLFVGNEAAGVDMYQSSGGNNVANNTITGNGIGPNANVESPGVRVYGSGSTISRNVINANFGAGVMVTSSSTSNVITRNSIYANGTVTNKSGAGPSNQIGIDLLNAANNQSTGTSTFVTVNDASDSDAGGNGLLNFPVLTSARILNGSLILKGYAAPGATVELFVAAPDPTGFGEGQTYLLPLVEGSASDEDAGTGTYTSPLNGQNVGTDTTNLFQFTLPVPSGVAVGTTLTSTATVGGSTSEFSNNIAVTASPPEITLTKDCIAPANCTTESQVPGSELTYRVTFINVGGAPALNFVLTDPGQGTGLKLNDYAAFKLGSVSNDLGTTGLGVTVSYSNDNGATFAYAPASGAGGAPAGYDANVTHIRWTYTGTLSQSAPNNTGSATFIVRIK